MKTRLTNSQLKAAFEAINDEQTIDCSGDVMCMIKAGSVKMRSRWLVLTEYLGLRTSWILLLFVVVALVNLNLYILSQSPELEFIEFGSPAFWAVVQNLPYGWWAVASFSIVASILLMKRFRFSYISSFTLISAAVVSFAFFSGAIAFATGLNEELYTRYVEEPGASQSLFARLLCLCKNQDFQSDTALMGEVMFVNPDGTFIVQAPDLSIYTVISSIDTSWQNLDQGLTKYKTIKTLGLRDEDVFYATHIKIDTAEETMQLVRDSEDCQDKEKWEQKQDLAEKRRQLVNQPFTPAVGAMQLIMSIN